MKVYLIGREAGCDIVINDSTDVISRRHATLNVTSSGKMTIIDQSHNGTYVNGIRISQNVPVPVTRKDNVSFAHIARLDWNMVPKTTNPVMYVVIALIALAIIAGGIIGYNYYSSSDDNNPTPTDSIAIKQKDVDDAKAALKTKISEATGLRSAITNSAIADTLDIAIKSAQAIYDNASATKEMVVTATEALQKAIDVAGDRQKTKTPSTNPQQPSTTEKTCTTCKKKISMCQYKGKHPEVRKCGTCGKPLSECEYKGKHPVKSTSRSDR